MPKRVFRAIQKFKTEVAVGGNRERLKWLYSPQLSHRNKKRVSVYTKAWCCCWRFWKSEWPTPMCGVSHYFMWNGQGTAFLDLGGKVFLGQKRWMVVRTVKPKGVRFIILGEKTFPRLVLGGESAWEGVVSAEVTASGGRVGLSLVFSQGHRHFWVPSQSLFLDLYLLLILDNRAKSHHLALKNSPGKQVP